MNDDCETALRLILSATCGVANSSLPNADVKRVKVVGGRRIVKIGKVIRLRNASLGDLDFISRLEKRYASLGYVGSDSNQLHKQRMEEPDSAYLVIERLGEPVGFVILCGLNSINRSIELKRVAVSEPGFGTGREALRQVMRMVFSELSAHRLWLDVYSDNQRALRTYRALGFMEEGTVRECIWHSGRFRSLVLMPILEQEFQTTLLASPPHRL